MIEVWKNYNFEFTSLLLEEENFLGQEYLYGKLTNQLLKKFFPYNNIHFFPIAETSFEQSICIQNLHQENFFQNYEHILIDWPHEFIPNLSKIVDSFPSPICLTNKQILEKGTLTKEENKSPVYFIESYDLRRHIIKNCNHKNITCISNSENSLQKSLSQERNNTSFLLSNGLLPYLTSQFLYNSSQPSNSPNVCKNIFKFISAHKDLKILIIADFKVLIELNNYLGNYIEDNIIDFKKEKPENLYLSRPTNATCLEYSKINGFICRKIYDKNKKVDNWLEVLKSYFTELFFAVGDKYRDWTKMSVSVSEERDFFRFAYRLALEKGNIFPDTFDLLLAAKSVINSNFAYEMHKELSQFPVNSKYENALKQIEFPLDSFFEKTSKISLQKFATIQSQKSVKKTKLHTVHKNRPVKQFDAVSEDKYANNNWVNEDHPYSCSFPSEDIFMEKLAFDVKKNMREKIKDKEQILRELQSDFCDGLDLKETIRNWHKEKIIVKETLNVGKADIGAVIFNFAHDNNDDDEKFTWKSFWLAEQHDDSHLMFCATPFKDNLIGPGVAKSEFGGFAVIPLDSYIEHPWHHPYILTHARNNTECLILAGALSSAHKSVLFISLHPPSQHVIKILKQSGKNIIYASLSEFSQADIRRVRTFHILAEAGVRAYAQKYIRKD